MALTHKLLDYISIDYILLLIKKDKSTWKIILELRLWEAPRLKACQKGNSYIQESKTELVQTDFLAALFFENEITFVTLFIGGKGTVIVFIKSLAIWPASIVHFTLATSVLLDATKSITMLIINFSATFAPSLQRMKML